jgi:hypothetical protein
MADSSPPQLIALTESRLALSDHSMPFSVRTVCLRFGRTGHTSFKKKTKGMTELKR